MNINATILAQMIMFALFVWFCMKMVWPPIMGALAARQKQIADGLAAAEQGKKELDVANKKVAQSLDEAKLKAAEIIGLAEKRAQGLVDEAKKNAKHEAEQVIAKARAEITQEMNRSKEALRQEVAQLVVMGAERLLLREIDAKAHHEVLAEIANTL